MTPGEKARARDQADAAMPADADPAAGSAVKTDSSVRTGAGPYRLLGADGQVLSSPTPGTLGGHRRSRIYGRLDCRAARQALARGGYVRYRVFFADADSAVAAGYRPCAVCLRQDYVAWKQGRS